MNENEHENPAKIDQVVRSLKNSRIAESSSIPLYHQLARVLEETIREQELQPGDRVPSEESIADCFDVSRPTVNKAIQELLEDGWLVRERGRGTFVGKQPLVSLALLNNQLSLAEQFASNPGFTLKSEIISREELSSDPRVAEKLSLNSEETILFLRRLRSINEHPIMVCDDYLPGDLFPGLGEESFVRGSLYATLREDYSCIVERSERSVTATGVQQEEVADLLHVPLLSPIQHLTGVTYSQTGQPVEYMEAYIKGGVQVQNLVEHSPERETAEL